jgi:serine/threonine protein kinase/Tol biopolymer transport system component
MSVDVGTRLGFLEITALLGKGGMGEVYRARDTKLKRDVAIKILPDEFSRDSDRVSRFQREAELLASLNHPNIAAIYDVQEAGATRFLVLELVEGETLAERIHRGPIPVEEALDIAKHICGALGAAHEKGIIHRDLKPSNVKLTPDGKVKVLDFGLAKAFEIEAAEMNLSNSPTLMSGSVPGVILGPAAYISPEQAKGNTVDRRVDIWAFGVVLYEMLTGRILFSGATVSETVAAVITKDPDWTLLPATTPQSIRVLLGRCLQKDAKRRLRDAADVHIEIDDALGAPAISAPPPMAIPLRPVWQRALPWAGWLLAVALSAGFAFWTLKSAPAPRPVSRTVVALSQGERLAGLDQRAIALSPDGTQLVYVAIDNSDRQRLYLRAMDSLAGRPISGTEGASGPFFSPDGQWIGFFAEGKLKKVQIRGGLSLVLDDVVGAVSTGGSWGSDDSIVFAPTGTNPLFKVSAAGGARQPLTTFKGSELSHRWPQFLPGGKALLFTVANLGAPDDSRIELQRLDTDERKILVRSGTDGRYSPTGHLVYYRAGTLMAAPFDLGRLEVIGTPVPVLEGVMSSTAGTGAGQFSFSNSGSLLYVAGSAHAQANLNLAWVDRKGAAQPLPAPARPYSYPYLSPDGRLVAVQIGNDIWIYDLNRDTLTRLTFEGRNILPSWTPDGKRVVYSSDKNGTQSLSWRLADGSGPEERLFTGPGLPRPGSFTPDGRSLLYVATDPKTVQDIWVLPLEGGEARKPHVFLQSPFGEFTPFLSPDGRWVAYLSNESGRPEVYVRPFPGPGGKWQISTEGGIGLKWSPKGNELFYRTGPANEKVMVVDIQTQPTFSAGKPRLLFEAPKAAVPPLGGTAADYSVSPDGQRFLMVRTQEQPQTSTQINVVLNWFEELKQRVPVH